MYDASSRFDIIQAEIHDLQGKLVGGLLSSPECFGEVLAVVGPDGVRSPGIRTGGPDVGLVWKAMVRLHEAGSPLNISFVFDELTALCAEQKYPSPDGACLIEMCSELWGVPAWLKATAQRLVTLQNRVRLRDALLRGAEDALSLDSPADLLERVRMEAEGMGAPGRPLSAALHKNCSGTRYLAEYPPSYEWLLEQSLRRACLGVIAGPPGAGKGMLSVQLCVAVAAGEPWAGTWRTKRPEKAVYLSAEDDEATIHRRIHHALNRLPAGLRQDAAARVLGISVHGDVSLCRTDGGNTKPSANIQDLRRLLLTERPALLVLDTLARFSGVEENDNPAITAFCAMLEDMIAEFDCNIVLLHHVNKAAGDVLEDKAKLGEALSQTAIRGASALAGCVRWAMLIAPLGKNLALKTLGTVAQQAADGSFIAARVGKKNTGAPEPRHFFGRDGDGLLFPVEAVGPDAKKDARAEDDAHFLAQAVREREVSGLPPISKSRGARDLCGWGGAKAERVTAQALRMGLLREEARGQRTYLVSFSSDVPSFVPEQDVPVCPDTTGTKFLSCKNTDITKCPGSVCPDMPGQMKKVNNFRNVPMSRLSPLKGEGERDKCPHPPPPSLVPLGPPEATIGDFGTMPRN